MKTRIATIAFTVLFFLCGVLNVSLADESGTALKKKGEVCFNNEDGFYVQLFYSDLGGHNYIASGRQTGPDGRAYPVYGSMQIIGDRILGLLKSSYIDQGLIMETVAHYAGDASTLLGEYDVIAYHCYAATPGPYTCGVSHLGHFATIPAACP